MEIIPSIYQFKIPMPNSPLGALNSYLIRTVDGCILIDSGWNTDEAMDALRQEVEAIGVEWQEIKYIAITHSHPDHYGLVCRLNEITEAKVLLHELEDANIRRHYLGFDELLTDLSYWLSINGMPDCEQPLIQRSLLGQFGYVAGVEPNMLLQGGEIINLGGCELEVIWTPGHSDGHICFYERKRRILFSGDHILGKITPIVSKRLEFDGDQLAAYLKSLELLGSLEVDIVCPGHGEIITNCRTRIDELINHHLERNDEAVQILKKAPANAYEVATQLTWSTGGIEWADLSYQSRRMATSETIAHLDYLAKQGVLELTPGIDCHVYTVSIK